MLTVDMISTANASTTSHARPQLPQTSAQKEHFNGASGFGRGLIRPKVAGCLVDISPQPQEVFPPEGGQFIAGAAPQALGFLGPAQGTPHPLHSVQPSAPSYP